MKKIVSLKFLVFAILLFIGTFFLGQAILGQAPTVVSGLLAPKKTGNLEVQPIDTGKVGTWTSAGIFPTPRERYSMVYSNGYAYLLGGTVGWGFDGDITSTVLYAPVDQSGNFGEWKYTNNIPAKANFDNAAFTANGYVYVIGGNVEKLKPTPSVWYAKILPDRSLGEWMNTSPLPFPTYEHDLVYRNGYVYVVGGRTRNPTEVQLSQVFYASVNGDGALGDWRETTALPVGNSSHEAVAIGNHIYVLGGEDFPGYSQQAVYVADFNDDGSISNWRTTTALPSKLEAFYAESLGNYIYVVGGSGFGIRGYKTVWMNRVVGSDGALGTWQGMPDLPREVSLIDGFIANKRINFVGGKLNFNGPGDAIDTTWSAPIDVANIEFIQPNSAPSQTGEIDLELQ